MSTEPQPAATPAPARPSYKGWAGIRRAFGTPSALTLAVLGFGSGLPFLGIASLTLATRLRESGLDLHSIGLISLASFFYLFKFLWAPLLDRYVFLPLGFLGRRRRRHDVEDRAVGCVEVLTGDALDVRAGHGEWTMRRV